MKTLWTPYISDHTINAICWTLIHSVWIGMGTALLSGLVIATTRKASAALRYRLLCSLLLLFVAAAGVTFYLEMRPLVSGNGAALNAIGGGATNNVSTFVVTTNVPAHVSLFEAAVAFLNRYTDVIFIAWLLFFVLKSLKMVSGLLYIQRIRNYKTQDVAEEFKQKIELFSRRIGIGRTVRLVQSELVKVPVAVGWLKPMILLPVGIIFQLSTEQLESILWHELAHIRRRDYLVNILQGLVETMFFFNPGLLWLSALIRAEREACCDDMVLSRMDRKANYLEALLAFGFEDDSKTGLAMGIGSGNQLRDRIKRMVSQENRRLNMAEKVVLALGLVLLSAFTGLPKTTNDAVKHLVHVISKKSGPAATAKPVDVAAILKGGPVRTQLTADTVRRKPDTATRFTSITFKDSDADRGNSDIQAKDKEGNKYHLVVSDNKLVAMQLNGVKVKDSELAGYQYMVRLLYRQLDEKKRASAEDIAAFLNKYKAEPGKNWTKAPHDKSQKDEILKKMQTDLRGDNNDKFDGQGKDDLIKLQMKIDGLNYEHELERAQHVIADLVKEGVVNNAAAIKWFGLSETELIVNGDKQSDKLQEKLKAKYGIRENYGLYYGPVKMTGTGVFIGDDAERERRYNFKQERLKDGQIKTKDGLFSPQPKGLLSPDKELGMQKDNDKKFYAMQQLFYQSDIALTPLIKSVTADLVSQDILKNQTDLSSLYLTNSSLIVNGVKLPEKIHKKLKNKYLKHPGYKIKQQVMDNPDFGLHFDSKTGSSGLGITSDKSGRPD